MAADLKLITDNLDLWTSALLTKSTAGRGSGGKVEAYGIKKLRALILELAVRGKLVPQDAGDEPASELLKRIQAEKDGLIASGKIKKDKPLSPINDEEKPFDLPNGWAYSNLGDVVEIVRGITFPGSEKSKAPEKGRIACLRTSNVQDQIEWDDLLYIREEFVSREDQLLKPHDIVMSMANSRELVGKVALVGERLNQKTSFGGFLGVLRPFSIDPRFVVTLLRTPHTREKLIDSASQTTNIANISLGKLRPLFFAIPPLAEQHRIVAKVDELMALCDQLEQQQTSGIEAHQTLVATLLATLTTPVRPEPVEGRVTSQPSTLRQAQDERLEDNNSARTETEFAEAWSRIADHFDTLFSTEHSIDQLKQTILQLAVMGKLVPQDPNDEPAGVLLEKIAKEKERLVKEGKIKNQNPQPEVPDDEKPFRLPSGWVWSHLPDIGELARGKSKHRPRNDSKLYANGSIPMIQTGDVAKAAPLISTYTALYNENGLSQSRLWPKGTMCITIAANIADTGVLAFDACFPDSVVGFIPFDEKLNVCYFDYFIRTAKSHLEEYAPSTAQKNINLEILGQLLVPLPPARELDRIVAKVDQLMALCDSLKARLASARTTQIHLADAIVEQAVA